MINKSFFSSHKNEDPIQGQYQPINKDEGTSVNDLTTEEIQEMVSNKKLRREIAKGSFSHFFCFYLPEYLKYDLAKFHYQIIEVVEDSSPGLSTIVAFRNSGKSTLITTAGILWSIFGQLNKKNVIIVSQTQEQAYSHLTNIRSVLEDCRLVKEDFGPFEEQDQPWNAKTLVIPKFDARITAVSLEQSIRGFRHKSIRPDLIICDDLEDSRSILSEDKRSKTKKLYSAEIAPLGDINTKLIMVGNYLHRDSLLMHLSKQIESGLIDGYSLFVPLLNNEGECNWPEKFQDQADIDREKGKVADNQIWAREYLLKEVRDDAQVLFYTDIRYYSEIPSGIEPQFKTTLASVDPAKSESETADYTGIVLADVYCYESTYRLYIHPRMINKRIKPGDLQDEILKINSEHEKLLWLIEDVSFQTLLLSQLEDDGVKYDAVKTYSKSKKERLQLASKYIKEGLVQFPEGASKKAVEQMVNIGQEKHDDLADAVSQMVNYCFDKEEMPEFASIFDEGPIAVKCHGMYQDLRLPDHGGYGSRFKSAIAAKVESIARSYQADY